MRTLLDLIVPSHCAGCRRPGGSLCVGCSAQLGRPLRVRVVPPVYALSRYRGPVRDAVLAYKERGRRELAGPFGAALAGGARELTAGAAGVWLVPAPSRSSAARRRGGDHVRLLAALAAASLAAAGTPAAVVPVLRLGRGARDSVGLDAAERAANLAGRIRAVPARLPARAPARGAAVVLVDDVATTGATAAACTAALARAGLEADAVLVLASAAPLLHSGDLSDRSVTIRDHPRTVGSVTA